MDKFSLDVLGIVEKVGHYQLALLKHDFEHELKVEEKLAKEFVSEVDKESEKILMHELGALLPEAGFWGEEQGKSGNQELVWVIDPIDGTTNYLAGLDYFSISIALIRDGKTIFGLVYQPSKGNSWLMNDDGVFWKNKQKLNLAKLKKFQAKDLSEKLIGTGFPYRSKDLRTCFYKAADYCLDVSRGMRRFGSAALDLCLLAEGTIGAFFETELQAYDVAAGLMFADRLGFLIGDEHSTSYNMKASRLLVLASKENFHDFHTNIVECYRNELSI